jgi:hypothetical protein
MAQEVPGGSRDSMEAETIHVFTNHETANLAAANLQAHGIHCWINSDDGGGIMPNLSGPGGVRLLVRPSDRDTAIALISGEESVEEVPSQDEMESASPSLPSAPPRKWSIGQLLVGVMAGVLLCLSFQWCKKQGTHAYYHYAASGKADRAWVYRNGHEVELLKDRNLDGQWDEWVYYEKGETIRAVTDNNFDGKADETWTYSNSMVVTMEKDTDFNGTPDIFYTYQDGLVIQADIRPNNAKFATQRELFQNGVLVEILCDPDGHGHFKKAVHYDPFFNPVSTNDLLEPL